MILSAPLRFAVEAAVLVAVALGLVATDLELLSFVLVMGAAWILVATAERMLSSPEVALPIVRRRDAERSSEVAPQARTVEAKPEAATPADETAAAETQPEPEVELEPEPEPQRSLEALPTPEPEPEPAEHADEPVVELPQTAHRSPDGWNIWDLERRAHERAGHDPFRDEEWNALLVSLRDYAKPDGTLPREFDKLVEESFSELISRRA